MIYFAINVLISLFFMFLGFILYRKYQKLSYKRYRNKKFKSQNSQEETMLEAFIKRFRDPEPAPVNEPQANPSSAPTKVTYPDPEMAGIPNSARPKISRINDLIKDIKTRIDQDILSKPVIIEMEQMRDRHVPKLLQSYVEIPPEHRREIFNQTGRSASVHLTESLDAIISRLEEIDKSLAKENLNTFADNAKFISQTYGSKSDPLG